MSCRTLKSRQWLVAGRWLGGLAWDLNDFRVAPQSVQIVVGARLFREHVDEVIAIIGQYPFGVREAFHAHRTLAAFIELPADLFSDGLNLFGIATGADYKKVGEGSDVAQIQHADVDGFLRFSGAGRGQPGRSGDRFCEFLPGSAA